MINLIIEEEKKKRERAKDHQDQLQLPLPIYIPHKPEISKEEHETIIEITPKKDEDLVSFYFLTGA